MSVPASLLLYPTQMVEGDLVAADGAWWVLTGTAELHAMSSATPDKDWVLLHNFPPGSQAQELFYVFKARRQHDGKTGKLCVSWNTQARVVNQW